MLYNKLKKSLGSKLNKSARLQYFSNIKLKID